MENRVEGFLQFLFGDDMDFYEEFFVNLSEDEKKRFWEEHPEFMKDYQVNETRKELLQDKIYREILRNIQKKKLAAK